MSTNKQALTDESARESGNILIIVAARMARRELFTPLHYVSELPQKVVSMRTFREETLQREVCKIVDGAYRMDKKLKEAEERLQVAEKRIAELEARPANPINFKENADADFCRKWAWDEVKKELAPEAWTVGDNFNYYGFFCWGWDSRRQYDEQRAAGITVKGE